MKKLIVGLVVMSAGLAACHKTTTTATPTPATTTMTGAGTGAADPMSALRGFMDAAKAQNIQGISAYWGDQDGTARGRFPKTEEEQREIIMARCLRHDRYDVIGDAPGLGGGRTYAISLSRPGRTATTNVDVVPATDHRWYVQKVDMDKLTDYCR
jgi:hypothetical protein